MNVRHSLGLIAWLATSGVAAIPAHPVEPRTADAVRAADDAWSAAETQGDAVFVEWLLAPGYVSVGKDGVVHTKAMIVESARKRAGGDAQAAAAKIAAWRAEHPFRTEVKLFGTTAVVSFVSTKAGAGEPVNSSDVFVYTDGHWHPIYSQHSSAGS